MARHSSSLTSKIEWKCGESEMFPNATTSEHVALNLKILPKNSSRTSRSQLSPFVPRQRRLKLSVPVPRCRATRWGSHILKPRVTVPHRCPSRSPGFEVEKGDSPTVGTHEISTVWRKMSRLSRNFKQK